MLASIVEELPIGIWPLVGYKEWRQNAPSRYRKAKDDVCYWITDEWYSFESPKQKEIETAYQAALKKNDDMAIALALSPFAQQTAELVNSGAYEAAAGSCYAIFRCLAKTCKEHEDWFRGFTGYGDTYTKLAIFTETIVELYCHLRQKSDLSKRMADEMDINLEVFNLETDFFGDLHCSSRFTDMLCDAQAQYGDYSRFTDMLCDAQAQYQDYSELDGCPMWWKWMKEGGRELTLREKSKVG